MSRRIKDLHSKVKHSLKTKKPDNSFTRFINKMANKYGLPFGIFMAICIALILTSVAMTLYFVSGASQLDLSRPGYETARKQIKNDEESQTFPSSGPIDNQVLSDFLNKYDHEVSDLNQYDNYGQDVLSDEQIGLTDEPVAPTDGAEQ